MNVFSIVSLAAFFLCFFLANFIYLKNSKNQLNIMISFLCILVGFLAFAEFQYRQTSDFETAYLWLKVSGIWPLVPSILLHISIIFTGKTGLLNKWTYVLIYTPAILIALVALDTNLLLAGILKEYWGYTYIFPKNSLLFNIMSLWTIICGFLAGGLCVTYYLKNKSVKRLQAKYLIAGLYFPLLISVLSDLVHPTMSIRVPKMTMAMSTMGLTFISFGVWKYRFPALTTAVAADKIVSTMSNFLIILDYEKNIVTVNQATTDITGYNNTELIGNPVKYILPDEKNNLIFFDAEFESISNLETYIKSKNGALIPVLLSKSVVKSDDSNILGIVCIDSNIANIKLAEHKIKSSLKEKEVLLRELHHRVQNNLQIILSLINLQSNWIKDKDDLELFKESQSRVKTMAIIHENLYQSADFASINFEEYIQSLVSYLLMYYSAEGIKMEINVKEIVLNMETAVPCGLIINELVSNSLKHAFPENTGKIKIELYPEGDCFTLIVGDDGIGIPPELDVKNPEKLGLQLVNSLTDQLEGKIEFNGTDGTEFKINFKELIYKDRI